MSPTRKDSHNVQPLVRKFGREAGISQSIMEISYRQKYIASTWIASLAARFVEPCRLGMYVFRLLRSALLCSALPTAMARATRPAQTRTLILKFVPFTAAFPCKERHSQTCWLVCPLRVCVQCIINVHADTWLISV